MRSVIVTRLSLGMLIAFFFATLAAAEGNDFQGWGLEDAPSRVTGAATQTNDCIYSFDWRCRLRCSERPSDWAGKGSPNFCFKCNHLCNSQVQALDDDFQGGSTLGRNALHARFDSSLIFSDLTKVALREPQHLPIILELMTSGVGISELGEAEFTATTDLLLDSAWAIDFLAISLDKISTDDGGEKVRFLDIFSEKHINSNSFDNEVFVLIRSKATLVEGGGLEITVTSDVMDEMSRSRIDALGDKTVLTLRQSPVQPIHVEKELPSDLVYELT